MLFCVLVVLRANGFVCAIVFGQERDGEDAEAVDGIVDSLRGIRMSTVPFAYMRIR